MSNFKAGSYKTATIKAIAILAVMSAMSAPLQAHASKVPGTCDLVRNTMCGAPASLLDQILAIFTLA